MGIAGSLAYLADVAIKQDAYQRATCLITESVLLFRDLEDSKGVASCLVKSAKVAMAQGQPERAARLLGTAAALREAVGTIIWPAELAAYEHDVARVRAALGEDRFSTAWAAGEAMDLQQAISYATDAIETA